jgi:hypothetical protein
MARLFVTSINLNGNELQNARIHNLTTAPSSPVPGQIYYNNTGGNNTLYFWNGSNWIPASGDTETVQDIVGAFVVGGTGIDATYVDGSGTLTIDIDSTVTTNSGSQTLTNKKLSDSTTTIIDVTDATKAIKFDVNGTTGITGTIATNFTTAKTITLPDTAGTVITTGDTSTVTNTMLAGSIANSKLANSAITVNSASTSLGGSVTLYAGTTTLQTSSANQALTGITSATLPGSTSGTVQLVPAAIAGTGTVITLPGTTGTVVTTGDTGTVTNAMLAGSIANNKLSNSTISGVSLGSNLNNLNISTGLSGSSYNGSGAVTIAIDSTVATLTGSQTLQSKTLGTGTALGANLAAGGYKITGLADPTSDQDAATKIYVDNAVNGLSWKSAANLLVVGNIALTGSTGSLTIDGHAALTATHNGYRLLLTGQTTATEKGIYTYSDAGAGYTLTRSSDANVYTELIGATIFIEEGTTYGKTSWLQSNHYLTSFASQNWVQMAGAGAYIAGAGLVADGVTFNIGAGTGITVNADDVAINTAVVVRKYSVSVGDTTNTSYTITHGLGTRDVTIQVYDNASPYAQIEADVEHTNTTTATIKFATAPTTDQFRVVVHG